MATNVSKENNVRKQMGFIKFPNRSYPVYEGLNVVGRDPKATVRVKDLIFSKQHAVITVVNEKMHFVSDFGSSNGTQLQGITCIPYKMYEISDWDTVIVGSIVGIYHTGTDENIDTHDNATQFNDTIPPTQLLTQDLHDKETELLPNTHDAETQLKPIINTVENDLDFSKSEVYDDICANETFRQQLTGTKFNVEVDETLPTSPKPTTDNSLDSDDIILSTQDNEMIDKQTLEILKPQPVKRDNNVEIVTKINNTDNNSDSDTDVDDDLLIKNQPTSTIDDDSATDIEDEESFVKKLQQQSTQFNTSNNPCHSETDANDDLLINKSNKTDDNSEDEELDLMGPTQKLIADSQNDDDLFLVPTQLLTDKDNIQKINVDIHDAPTQKINTNTHEDPTQIIEHNIHEAPTQLLEHKKDASTLQTTKDDLGLQEDEDDEDQTQDLLKSEDTLQKRCDESIQKQPDTQFVQKENDDFLAPTQPLPKITEHNIQEAPTQLLEHKKDDTNSTPTVKTTKDDLGLQEDEDDDDQTQDLLKSDDTLQKQPDIVEKNKEKENIEDDDFLAPTQLLEQPKNQADDISDDTSDDLPPTQLLTTAQVHQKDDEYLAPTQLLEDNILQSSKINKEVIDDDFLAPTQPIHDAPTMLLENVNDSVYSAATQPIKPIINTNSPKKKKTVNFSEDVIFDAPTQKIPDIYDQPTIELHKDLYDMPTQQLPNAEIEQNSESSNSDRINKDLSLTQESNLSLKLVLSDESFVEKPKQQLETQETQLEVNFELQTQKLYIEDKTRRPDNPLANIFAEEPTQNTADFNEDLNIECSKRLQNIEEASTITPKRGRPKKSVDKVAENAPKLNITRVKSDLKKVEKKTDEEKRPANATKLNITKVKPDLKKVEEIPVEEKRPTRGKRISYRQLNNGEIELKSKQTKTLSKNEEDENDDDFKVENIVRSPRKQLKVTKVTLDKIEDKPTVVETPQRSSRRLTKTPVEDLNDNSNDFQFNKRTRTTKDDKPTSRSSTRLTKTEEDLSKSKRTLVEKKKENKMEEKRSSRRQTRTPAKLEPKRSKRGHSITETPKKEEITIEDSSDSENFPVKKKLLKLEYTQDDNSNSNSSEIIKEKINKGSSSDETDNVSLHSNTKRRKYEPLNVTVTSSQENQVIVTHKVVFTMLNDTELENYVKKLGGSVIDSAQHCTVLITNKISRSLKFLVAVATGKPIVNANWVRDSMKSNRFLDPWNYLLVDTESETKFKFSLEKSLKKSVEKKLLTDVSILIAAKKNFEVLKEIIETSGGKVISRAPGKNSKAFVVSYEEERTKYSKYLKQKNLTVVSAEAIFSGVLQQEINWGDHLLT